MKVLDDAQLVSECMEERRIFLAGDQARRLLRIKHDTLQFLSMMRSRYRLVVVTARTSRDDVRLILERFGIAPYVDGMLCAQDIGGTKPAESTEIKKRLYSMAMRMYNAKSEMCAVVGNLKSDIVAGIELGMTSYAVSGPYGFDRGIRGLSRSFRTLSELAGFMSINF